MNKYILLLIIFLPIILLSFYKNKEHFSNNTFNIYALYIPSRYDYITSILNKIFNNVIYIEGPDKNIFNKDKLIIEGKISPDYKTYNNGRYACYLGHYNIWKQFINTNKEYALIFEDDINFNDDVKPKLLNIIDNIPNDADIVYVDYCYETCNNTKDLFYKSNHPLCNHCYIVSKKGAIKLIDKLKVMTNNKDEMMKELIIRNELISYSVNKDYIHINQNRAELNTNLGNNDTLFKCIV